MSSDQKKPMTRQGFERLQRDYDYLYRVLRPETVQRIADAAAEGDRSENAEYIYGRKKLRQIDGRLRYIGGLLKHAKVVDIDRLSGETVGFGASVVLEDEAGQRQAWTIVGVGEAESKDGTISVDSPVARALLGKRSGDIVEVDLPAGETEFEIIEVAYRGHPHNPR